MQKKKPTRRDISALSGSVKGAPRPRWDLFIYKVSSDTADEEMKTFIELFQIDVPDLVRLLHSKFADTSYKLILYPEDYKKIYRPHVWSNGVIIYNVPVYEFLL